MKWINPTENAPFRINVLTDLKTQGVEDILIASANNLKGFTDAMKTTFPNTDARPCLVHQIQNPERYVVWSDKKEFMADLKALVMLRTQMLPTRSLFYFKKNGVKNTLIPFYLEGEIVQN